MNIRKISVLALMFGHLAFSPWFKCMNECFAQSRVKDNLELVFDKPPHEALPGVYWYFMDGNISKDGMTKDLKAMNEAGLGHLVFLEVNVGVPRGNVDYLSDEWISLFKHAVKESQKFDIGITLGVGPGWTGSGGPWVPPEESMCHLVSSKIEIEGGKKLKIDIEKPSARRPYFGDHVLTPELKEKRDGYYEDVAVLAFPSVEGEERISDLDEKSLVYRSPYSSAKGVKQFLPMPAEYAEPDATQKIASSNIIDLTSYLQKDGTLEWNAPKGKWTIVRFGIRNNGAVTRPAPVPGLGFEVDKFDTLALKHHLDMFSEKLFSDLDLPYKGKSKGGLRMLHMDSWEMGAQNWTHNFRSEFIKRRGYDPFLFYPVYAGYIVDSREISERFLWDLRQTSQELILEYHAGYIKKYAHKYNLGLSIEPYDMNPTSDMELGTVADMPMCEFWSSEFGFNTSFSAVEGTSAAHIIGQNIVPSEAFTAQGDRYAQYPEIMKNQTDWAFAAGINRLMFHTFQHQALDDELRPGMTMGPYGVHWDRNQTWWPMVGAYHGYISKCQAMLQQGRTLADILYLVPEVSPHVFRAPESAFVGDKPQMRDRKGYNFDACPPSMLYKAKVDGNMIKFPGGASYRILVLPDFETMTPALLKKIKSLVYDGATVMGVPPVKSPSLSDYPACDKEIGELVESVWGSKELPEGLTFVCHGKGLVVWSRTMKEKADNHYPDYDLTASILKEMGLTEDFSSDGPIRYTHRTMDGADIYFVSNRSDKKVTADCGFRIAGKIPELWNPLTGEKRDLSVFDSSGNGTDIELEFDAYQSYFIVFRKNGKSSGNGKNFMHRRVVKYLDAQWNVSFDPKWGGVKDTVFEKLTDWSADADPRIKYYSGSAFYVQRFNMESPLSGRVFLDLGNVKNMARVWLNGKEIGTLWTSPWVIDITDELKSKNNELKVEVVNLWVNRLVGDDFMEYDGIKDGKWPEWMTSKKERTSGRYTFTTYNHYSKKDKLTESGLLGPVSILQEY